MTGLGAAVLILQGVVFAAWIFVAFRTFFDMFGRARRLSGKIFPGPGWALHAWANWWRDNRVKPQRMQFIVLTIALFVLILVFLLVR